MTSNQLLLATTAITMLGSMGHAQDVSFRQLGQLMTVTGGNDQAAFAFGPEWSEDLGFSATGRVGFTLGEGAAVGFIGELGENVTEGMVNLGFLLPNDMSMILTAGQLRERLEFGDAGDREWVEQDEYGIAINGDNLAFNAYYVDAASTENFLGAMSYGAEIEGSTDISDNATLAASLGYQRMEWDGDAFEALEEVTGSVDLAINVTDTFRLNTFADYNISEAQAGIGASWAIGSGSLDVDYTYIQMDDRSGLADDHRVGLTFSMPLGGGAGAAVASRDRTMPGMVTASTQGARRGAGLLAEVMRRPEYLPERLVSGSVDGVVCETYETTAGFGIGDAGPGGFDEITAGFFAELPDGFVVNSININQLPAPAPDWQGYNRDAVVPQEFFPPGFYIFEWRDETIVSPGDMVELEYTLNGGCFSVSLEINDT